MPDKEEKKPALRGVVAAATGNQETKQASFPVAVILMGIAILGFAVMGFLLMRAKRKAARLAAELRRKEEEQLQAAEELKLAKNAEARDAAIKKAEKAEAEAVELRKQFDDLKKSNEARKKAISELSDWDDLVIVDKRGEAP
jgi:uncharacterized protein HemX